MGPRRFAILLGALCATAAPAELVIPTVRFPMLTPSAASAGGFAPKGWSVERQATGDLDGDGRNDLAIVLRMRDPRNVLSNPDLGENPFDTNPRILAVALAQERGGYRLALQNHRLIPRREYTNLSDPFGAEDTDFEIRRGALRLSLYRFASAGGWDMGTTAFTFRWQGDALRLIGFDYTNVRRNSGCTSGLSINYLTGRAKLTLGHIGLDREQARWRHVSRRPLLTVDAVGDGLEFDGSGMLEALPSDCHAAGLAPDENGG